MGYVDRRLTTGEALLYRTRLHWVVFAAPALVALGGGAALAFGALRDGFGGFGSALDLIGLLALLSGGGVALARWVVRSTSEFAVTNKRVLIKVGVVSRHSLELVLSKIESIAVDQDALGRLLNYGTVVVTGSGGTHEEFPKIAHPYRFRSEIQSRVLP